MALDKQYSNNTIVFTAKIVPASSKTKISGLLGESLKINIASAPENGKANKELINFLAKTLNLTKKDIEIIAGLTNTRKKIKIHNCPPALFDNIINEKLK